MDSLNELVPTIIQGGAVGISVLLIFLIGWIFKSGIKFVQTALERNTEATNNLVAVIGKLVDHINIWTKAQ